MNKLGFFPKNLGYLVRLMGRYPTSVPLLNELTAISIADLKRLQYLKSGHRAGNIQWRVRGQIVGNVDVVVLVNDDSGHGYLELSYYYQKEHWYQYQIPLVATPTNLGIGQRWYFECPTTEKRCTKLFLANGIFQHRQGITGAMYSSQTRSHRHRDWDKFWGAEKRLERPYMKTHYRGRPTRRYLKAFKAFERSETDEALLLQNIQNGKLCL